MGRRWTFGQRMGAGFGVIVLLSMVVGVISIYGVWKVNASKDRVIDLAVERVLDVERLRNAALRSSIAARRYLLTGNDDALRRANDANEEFIDLTDRLRRSAASRADEQALIDAVEQASASYAAASDRVIEMRRTGTDLAEVGRVFEAEVVPQRDAVERRLAALNDYLNERLDEEQAGATRNASRAVLAVVLVVVFAAALAAVVGILLARHLTRHIGEAVGQVQSSSAELEAVATQQANGAREQATAMSEITTTINELVITSRQIVETAQRVYRTAEDTAGAARSGEGALDQTRTAIAAIRQQVDLVVAHMLELGEKSQRIGGVVELVSELAEQTNILAINATIEASGAGEWGRRFAVVADEIRKLADRTAASAKEIGGLVEGVRGAVNTTVMATETGAKAVDDGSQRFDEMTASFGRITTLVGTTTDAAREIELSTKQQTSAVEQANVAVADTGRVARETEASAAQTRQTANQLAALSSNLLRLVSTRLGV